MLTDYLRKTWNETCKELDITWQYNEPIISILDHNYSLPERAYHNWKHIEFCLKKWNGLKEWTDNVPRVGGKLILPLGNMAYFFHDFIYNFEKPIQNKRDSALLSDNLLAWAGMDKNNVDTVNYLIGLTDPQKSCNRFTTFYHSESQKKFRDIDYLSLAGEWRCVQKSEKGIRQENNFMSNEEYKEKRIAFLNRLIAGKVFLSKDFISKYEAKAKENTNKLITMVENY